MRGGEGMTAKLKWEAHGVSLDRAPCGVVNVGHITPRADTDRGSKSINKY